MNIHRLYRNINGKTKHAIVLTDGISIITLDCAGRESANNVFNILNHVIKPEDTYIKK